MRIALWKKEVELRFMDGNKQYKLVNWKAEELSELERLALEQICSEGENEPLSPTLEERLEALEYAMLRVLDGGN